MAEFGKHVYLMLTPSTVFPHNFLQHALQLKTTRCDINTIEAAVLCRPERARTLSTTTLNTSAEDGGRFCEGRSAHSVGYRLDNGNDELALPRRSIGGRQPTLRPRRLYAVNQPLSTPRR